MRIPLYILFISYTIRFMAFNFQRFEGVNKKYETRIGVARNGAFVFPYGFCKENEVKQFKFIELFYDQEHRAVAFHFSSDQKPSITYTLAHGKVSGGASVSCSAFFKTNGISATSLAGKKFTASSHDDETFGKMFIINLLEHESSQPQA